MHDICSARTSLLPQINAPHVLLLTYLFIYLLTYLHDSITDPFRYLACPYLRLRQQPRISGAD